MHISNASDLFLLKFLIEYVLTFAQVSMCIVEVVKLDLIIEAARWRINKLFSILHHLMVLITVISGVKSDIWTVRVFDTIAAVGAGNIGKELP